MSTQNTGAIVINNKRPVKSNQAIASLTNEILQQAFNTGGFKMENYGTADDTVSSGIKSRIQNAMREGGFGRFAGRKTKAVQPGAHRVAVKFEDAAEDGSITEGTQNEEILLTEAQEKAGVIAAAMADNPAEWAKQAVEATNDAKSHINNTDDGVEFSDRVKLEAYDDSNFRDAVGYSVIWNVVAARQSNAVENVWPTIVLEPNQSHVEAIVQFQVFHHNIRHKSSGDAQDWGRILMLEAIIDGDLVDESLTKVVPVVLAGESDHHFIASTLIAPRSVTVEGETVLTAPLLVNKEHNLIGLGAAAIANLTGDLTSSTQLAPMPRMENLYVQITNKDNVKSIIRVDATSLPYNSFTAAPEMNARAIQLNMILKQIPVDATTVDVTGAPAPALAFLRTPAYQKHRVEYQLKVKGDGNLEFGTVDVQVSPGQVSNIKIQQALGHFTAEKDQTVLDDIKANIKSIEMLAYDVDANRTNIDRLQRGPLTNITAEREKYYVRLGSPIATIFPATEATSNVDLLAPMTLTRIKNDIQGIKALYRNAEVLAGLAISYDNSLPRTETKAIGRYIMTPFYRHVTISALDIVDSNRSKNKLEDLQHAFLNYIRDVIIHAMRDSKYELALQVQTGSSETKPTLAMITNQVLGKYLFQLGDTRILGSLPYPVVADTHANKLLGQYGSDEHELFIVPTLPGTQMDPLNYGHFFWKPELASTLQVTRDQSTNREVVVQPCCEHHMTCPWMIRITVTDLTHVMTTKTPLMVMV